MQQGIFLFLVWMLLCTGLKTEGQEPGYNIVNYTTDNGLPQNSVKSIAFDKAGFCWLATEMGLVRFDGKTFTVFQQNELPGIGTSRVQSVMPDDSGRLTASFSDRFATRVNIMQPAGIAAPLPAVIGNLRIVHWRHGYLTDEALIVEGLQTLGLPAPEKVFALSEEGNGIWGITHNEAYIVIRNGLHYLKKNSKPLSFTLHNTPGQQICLGNTFINIANNNIVQAWRNGIEQANFTGIAGPLAEDAAFLAGNFKVLWCPAGAFVYCNKNIYRLNISQNTISSTLVIKNIDGDSFMCINYLPKDNIYFLGSRVNGLSVITPSVFTYPEVPLNRPQKDQNFYTQAVVDSSQLFCSNIIFSLNNKPVYRPIIYEWAAIMYPAGPAEIYFKEGYNICTYNFNTQQKKYLANLQEQITCITSFEDDPLTYVATNNSIATLYNRHLITQKILPLKGAITFLVKQDSVNFIAATKAGVHWCNWPAGKVYKSLLDSLNIRNLYLEKNGRLWIGTYDHGFFLYENNRLYPMPAGQNGALKTVHAIIDDGRDFFWISTNNGLFKVAKAELLQYASGKVKHVYYYMFSKMDGLRTNEFNGGYQSPYVWFADSMLSLPSLNGLAWFHPNRLQLNYPAGNIYIDMVMLNGREWTMQNGLLNIPPGSNNLSFHVSSPYYGNAGNLQMEYQVHGLRNEWMWVPADGNVTMENLPPGNYTITVRKRSGGQYTAFTTLQIAVKVRPAFYQSWWFYVLFVLVLAAGIVLFIRWRFAGLRRQSALLESKVALRTSQLQKSQSSLAESNRVKDQVISMVLHDLRSPVRFLDMLGRRLAKNHTQLDAETRGLRIAEIRDSTSSLYSFVDQFFVWASSQHKTFTVHKKWVPLQPLFDDIEELYLDMLKAGNVALVVHDTTLQCYTDADLLMAILRNLVDNAQKNTASGSVEIMAALVEAELWITVSDTGTGMSPEQVRAFFDKEGTGASGGLGSILILGLAARIDGRITIESQPGGGTRFTIILPNAVQEIGRTAGH